MKSMSSIVLLLLSVSLLSCGSQPTDTGSAGTSADTASAVTAEQEAVLISDLPATDWGGRTFTVLGRESDRAQFTNFEITAQAENGEVVNDAVFRRNSRIEETYNVHIDQTLDTAPQDALQLSASSGDHLYDLAFLNMEHIGTAAQNGCLYDLNTVEYLDFSKPWWNPDVNEAVSLCDKLYFTTSDFSLRDKNRTYILVYNIDMTAEYDLEDPVSLVREGVWTIDRMTEYVKMISQDLNGDGQMGAEDKYGLGMYSYTSFSVFTIAQDNRLVSVDDSGAPYIAANTERMVNSIEKSMALTCNTDYAIFCNDFDGKVSGDFWSVAVDAFYENRAMFLTCFPHSLATLSEKAECNYGVVPFPKYDEAQETYLTLADWQAMMFGIPATAEDTTFAGFMLEALSAGSMNTTLPAYYDISCKTKYSYNTETGEMLDLIFDGIYYEPAMIYGLDKLTGLIKDDIAAKKVNKFSSLYEKYTKASQASLDRVIEALNSVEH